MTRSSASLIAVAAISILLLVNGVSAASHLNFTDMLVNGGQYTTFIRLLGETQVSKQIDNQLNNSNDGFTVFAPTDNAFNNLKPGTLNDLSDQEKVALIQFHVIPKFLTFTTIKTASNPIRTQGNGDAPYNVNITAQSNGNQFNVSTGVNTVSVTNALNVTAPLAIYSIDEVLLPLDLFGPKTPATPAAAPEADKKKDTGTSTTTTSSDDTSPKNGGYSTSRSVGWVGWSVMTMISFGMLTVM